MKPVFDNYHTTVPSLVPRCGFQALTSKPKPLPPAKAVVTAKLLGDPKAPAPAPTPPSLRRKASLRTFSWEQREAALREAAISSSTQSPNP